LLAEATAAAGEVIGHRIPEFRVGDTVQVYYRMPPTQGGRLSIFEGVVVKRHRAGLRSSFTVRLAAFNLGVERVFLLHSPRIEKFVVVTRGAVRHAYKPTRLIERARLARLSRAEQLHRPAAQAHRPAARAPKIKDD
jgi:large subunit ribosomal protein L19